MLPLHSLVLSAFCLAVDPPPTVLYSFEGGFDVDKVETSDVRAALVADEDGQGLALAIGHENEWPGITLRAPAGGWDLSAHERLEIDVLNTGPGRARLNCRVDNPGADGVNNCNNGSVELDAGERGTLTVVFRQAAPKIAGVELFGMRGYPINGAVTGTIDTAGVTGLVIFVGRPAEDTAWVIDNIRAAGSAPTAIPPPTAEQFMPFVDTFGQYMHHDWPGKVHSLDELRARAIAEAADLATNPPSGEWNEWGGWAAGPQLDATGFFRVTKHEGRWWLVDPSGRLFWSHGIDCVGAQHSTPIDERDSWWQDFPGNQADLAQFRGGPTKPLHGHYAGRQVMFYSFSFANLVRKYGEGWREQWFGLAHDRIRSWGMNTIGNWSQWDVMKLRRTPYVATAGTGGVMLAGSEGYWGQFRDVFDPSFERDTRANLEHQRGGAAGDPYCLGFFVDNEIAWGDDTSLAIAALVSPPEQAAKRVFIEDLRDKYGEVDRLNAVWGTTYGTWAAVQESTAAPDKAKAREDLTAFYSKFAGRYFQVVRDAVKAVAPNQLYLGCRFAWVNDLAAAQAAEYCDVVSYNLYRRDIADFKSNAGDVPLIVGEFHFGALDRGMFHTGLVSVGTQQDRADLYRSYVEGALRHPQFVGTHWFEYQDEPLTGRALDEENYQIGFIDQADTPYPETVAAARAVGARMYRLRSGQVD